MRVRRITAFGIYCVFSIDIASATQSCMLSGDKPLFVSHGMRTATRDKTSLPGLQPHHANKTSTVYSLEISRDAGAQQPNLGTDTIFAVAVVKNHVQPERTCGLSSKYKKASKRKTKSHQTSPFTNTPSNLQ